MPTVNTRKYIAAECPDSTNEVQLYEVGDSTIIDGIMRVCNLTSSDTVYSVAHCPVGHGDTAALPEYFIMFETALPAKTTHEISIHTSSSESLRVKSGTADAVTFHLSGNVNELVV